MDKHGTGERGIFKYVDGKMVKVEKLEKILKPIGIITDEMEPIQSYATPHREVFTSKSRYRRHLAEHGFRETGGDHLKERPLAKTEADREREAREDKEIIEAAYMDVKYQRVPFSEKEKQNHLEEQRRWGEKYRVKSPI